MTDGADWRLKNQERYLSGVELTFRRYAPAHVANDHDHCEFCFAKFMVGDYLEVLHEGYATLDGERWVCEPCFRDFQRQSAWRVAS